MSLIFRLYGISLENDYQVFYKKGKTLNDKSSEFIQYGDVFKKEVDSLIISGISIEYSTQYWFKIVDTVTNEYLIKNLITHQSKAFHPYDNIEFHVMVSGKTVTLYDDTIGNNASIINNKPKTYRIYSGSTETSFINGSVVELGVGTTDITTKKIFEYEATFDDDFYVFLVHGDGYNLIKKKQGGFNVRKVVFNPFVAAASNSCYFDVEAVIDTVNCTTDFDIVLSTPPSDYVTPTPTSSLSTTELDYLNDTNIYYVGNITNDMWNQTTKEYKINYQGNDYDIIKQYKDSGYNAVHLELLMNDIFVGNIDDTPNWVTKQIKEKLTKIKESGLYVFLRVDLFYERLYSADTSKKAKDYYNGYDEVDQWGNTSDFYNGREPFTLSDDIFRAKIVSIFNTIVKYAYDILGSQLKWVSPVLAYSSEWGYTNQGSYWWTGTTETGEVKWYSRSYIAVYGYNEKNTSKFREFLKLKYQNINGLNTAWGTSYTNNDFSDITLPKLNRDYNNGENISDTDFFEVFSGKKGEDFYLYRTNNLLVFAKELKNSLKSINKNLIFTCEIGSSTGANTISQGNLDIEGYAKIFDLIKGDSSIIGNSGEASPGWDRYSRFNVLIGDEESNFDLDTSNLDNYYNNLYNIIITSLNLGQHLFYVSDSPSSSKNTWSKTLAAVSAAKQNVGTTRKTKVTTTNNLTLTLSDILTSKNNNYITQQWNNKNGSKTVRFNIIVNGFEYINNNIVTPGLTPTATSPLYLTPTASKSSVPTTEITFCQDYSNHQSTEPHIFSQKSQSDGKSYIVGNIVTYSTPQYRVGDNGEWYDMVLGGTLFNGQYFVNTTNPDIPEKMYFFKTNYVDNVYVYLRPKNCNDTYIKRDGRLTFVNDYLGVEKFTLPTLSNIYTPANIDIQGFNFSSDIADNFTNNQDIGHAIYLYEFAGSSSSLTNLKVRINEGQWYLTKYLDKTYYKRPFKAYGLDEGSAKPDSPKKDFYMDFTTNDGQTYDRYIVRRCTAGGHFAVIFTLTRLHDKKVFVSTYEGHTNVPFKLIYGTTTYNYKGFGNSFDLGTGLSSGIYTMTLKFDTTNVTVDDNLKVIVE